MYKTTLSAILLIAVSLLFLSGCGSKDVEDAAKSGGEKLDSKALFALLSGNTIHIEEYSSQADVEMYTDGTLLGRNNENDTNPGRWYIEDDGSLCIKFRKWGHGDKVCNTVYRTGDHYTQFSSIGIQVSTFTVTPGTSKNQPLPRSAPQMMPATATTEADTVAEVEQFTPEADYSAEEDLRVLHLDMARNCPGCNLSNVSLPGANLEGAVLPGADLSKANMRGANLKLADLKGALLAGANLAGANLAGADLAGANLSGADLRGAKFFRANVKGAVFENAIGADLSGTLQ